MVLLTVLLNLLTRGLEWGTSHCRLSAQIYTPLISAHCPHCAGLRGHLDKTTVSKDRPEERELSTVEGQ